jgi:hypothetical protein
VAVRINFINMEELSEFIVKNAKKATESLLPSKSKQTYEKEYEKFKVWQSKNNVPTVNETVLLAYFQELAS